MFWLPPEMMMGHEYGLNVDCWSLGATVYEMARFKLGVELFN